MTSISIPADRSIYPEIIGETVMAARTILGETRLSVSYRQIPGGIMPELMVEFFGEKGKQYSLRYHFPVDTPERTDRRMSLLMRLINREVCEDNEPEAT